jgi:hypothetical protein
MAFFGDSDIPFMLKELGVAVTAAGKSGFGILDLNDEITVNDGERGQVSMRAITLEVQTSFWPRSSIATDAALVANDPITGTPGNYVVINPLSSGDGALTKLLLRKA